MEAKQTMCWQVCENSASVYVLIHNDRRRAIYLSNAGQTMLNGAESERDAAWREIEKLSNLTSGPSGGGA